MTKWLSIFLISFVSLFRARRDLAFENLLLRQQLAILKEQGSRLRLSQTDRTFWVVPSGLFVRLEFVTFYPNSRLVSGHVQVVGNYLRNGGGRNSLSA